MKLIKEIRGKAAILTLKGDFDSFVCKPFIEQVNALRKEGVNNLVVDLRLVLFINSTGVGTLIRIHKEAKAQGGALVLSRPSKFVAGVLDTLGLTNLFKIYDDPEKAVADLDVAQDGAELGGDTSVILDLPGKEKCVAKMAALEEEGMTLVVPDAPPDIVVGMELKLKFRLPLFMKSHYFEAAATITEAARTNGEARIKCAFRAMDEESRKSISQFVKEMKFLKEEARKSG